MILAGDIGGTKTILAIFSEIGGQLEIVTEQKFASREHQEFNEIVRKFVAAQEHAVERVCFGIAGPVKNGRSTATNLPWIVDTRTLANNFGFEPVGLINDLEATAYGLSLLEPEDCVVLNPGADHAEGNVAIIAAGTGLGEAGAYWDGNRHHPFACEGGHGDFAPRNELEIALFRFLQTRFGHVSYERVLSGPGIYNIYKFLRDTLRVEESDRPSDDIMPEDMPAFITQKALEGRNKLCAGTLDLFVSLYGAEAGNLALKTMATGGIYVGGGIAPKIIEKLKDDAFMQAFFSKGRMHPLLKDIPVRVILNQKTALLGAAHHARLRGGDRPLDSA
jgi:glucokinase